MNKFPFAFLLMFFSISATAQVSFTANDFVPPYFKILDMV